MEQKTEEFTLNDLITDEQIAEIKKSVMQANSGLFSYIELVRKTLDYIEENKGKE